MHIKKPTKENWKLIHTFLDKNLRPNASWSVAEEYPLAFAEKNRVNVHFIEKDQEVVSHAVVHPTMIRTPYHLFKVGLIGSVVTSPDSRGQGYSASIIEHCVDSIQKQDCDLAVLWTDLFNFYSKFGFEVAGNEIALQIDKNYSPPEKKGLKVLDTKSVSSQAILSLYNRHSLKTIRTASDIEKYLKIPNSELYTAWNQQTNQLEAYCVLGKGADFFNYIHEWGGNVSSLLHLVKKIYETKQQRLTLISPPQSENLIRQLEDAGAEKFFGVLGMIRITSPESFCKKIKRGARSQGYKDFIFDFREGHYFFGSEQEVYKTDSDQDIIRLVFGPLKPERVHNFKPETLDMFNQLFPMPFWIWGWDSI